MKQGAGLQLPRPIFRCQKQNKMNYQHDSAAYEGTISYTSNLQIATFHRCTHLPARV